MDTTRPHDSRDRRDEYHYSVYYEGDRAQEESSRAYRHGRDRIFRHDIDLSIYRLVEAAAGSMAAIGFYVALVGEQPPGKVERRLRRELAGGEPVELPEEKLEKLRERRRRAREEGEWVERRHPRPGEPGFGEPRV